MITQCGAEVCFVCSLCWQLLPHICLAKPTALKLWCHAIWTLCILFSLQAAWNPSLGQEIKIYCLCSLLLFLLVFKISTDHLHEEKPGLFALSFTYEFTSHSCEKSLMKNVPVSFTQTDCWPFDFKFSFSFRCFLFLFRFIFFSLGL